MRRVSKVLILTSALLALAVPAGSAELRRFGDHQLYTKGPFSAFMDPFNKREYVAGKDFDQSFTVDPDRFPSATKITWNWPIRDPRFIVGFLQAAAYGDYFSTVPQQPIPPARVNDIQQLVVSHDLSFSGTHNGYDVIYDYFLTREPHGAKSHLFEIEVFLHTPEYSVKYFNTATPLGTFADRGVQWRVAIDRHPKVPDILFIPVDHADHAKGTIDLQAMHLFLKSKGILTGEEYYNGHSLGVEPAQGTGSLYVNSVAVNYR